MDWREYKIQMQTGPHIVPGLGEHISFNVVNGSVAIIKEYHEEDEVVYAEILYEMNVDSDEEGMKMCEFLVGSLVAARESAAIDFEGQG